MTVRVGLVVNPIAGHDVRRLTSLARTIDVHERINIVTRILAGLAAAEVPEVLYMSEPMRVVERALGKLDHVQARRRPEVFVAGEQASDANGTAAAAAELAASDAACVITLGGDGTNRAVATGWPSAVLVPLPGGTNNALATWIEPAAAGLAAGWYAAAPRRHESHLHAAPMIEVEIGSRRALALVDVAVVRGTWIGAHAIWDPARLSEAFVVRSDPAVAGLAGLAGMVAPLDGDRECAALHLRFGGGGDRVLAPLGPGQFVDVEVRDWRRVPAGEWVELDADGRTVAVDGEREIPPPRHPVRVRRVDDGPRILNAPALLRAHTIQRIHANPT